jgi:phosphoribosylformimino-5-aminoimidazole carboxamide ribotide isomerase
MQIIPVLDVLGGQVVRGIAGRRQEYRPIRSSLTTSSAPLDVARAYRDAFGLEECYLADLDALGGAEPSSALYIALVAAGFRLWVDAGLRDARQAQDLAGAGVAGIVAGLETWGDPAELSMAAAHLGERLLFSLDLAEGRPLGAGAEWPIADPVAIALEATQRGVSRVLVLELSRVGTHAGTGTEALCAEIIQRAPGVEVWAGGGVRGLEDLQRLRDAGVARVLVASALHDGRLRREDLDTLRRNDR